MAIDLKAVITAEDKATPVLNKFHTSVTDIAKGVVLGQAAFAGLKAATNGLIGVFTSSIKSFSDSQVATSQLEAVLKSTKNAAGLTSQELQNMASSLQKTSTFSDEAVLGAESLLLTFTKIGKEVFPQATQTILDMSTALGQDTKSSAIQLGKALNDPIQGVTALRRVGVSFNEQQLEQIKTMQESGNLMGAQKLILQELATEFGGSAAAKAKTFAGSMEILNNNIDDMRERIGQALIQGIQPFVTKLNEFITSEAGQKFLDKMTASIDRFFKYIMDHKEEIYTFLNKTKDGFLALANSIESVYASAKKAGDFLNRMNDSVNNAGKSLNSKILGGFSVIDAIKGMFRAEGGPVAGGQPYIVGERGPEMFVPSGSGRIIPNNQINNSSSSTVLNFNGPINMNSNWDITVVGNMLARQIQMVKMGAA